MAKSLLETSGGCRLSGGGLAGEAAGDGDDHGPVDVGLMVGAKPVIVADGPAVAGNPRQRPLYDPAAGQYLEGVQVIGPPDDLQRQLRLELAPGPGDEVAVVAAISPGQLDRRECPPQIPQQRPGGVAVLDGRDGDVGGGQQADAVDMEMRRVS